MHLDVGEVAEDVVHVELLLDELLDLRLAQRLRAVRAALAHLWQVLQMLQMLRVLQVLQGPEPPSPTSRRQSASMSSGSVAVSFFERPSRPKSGLPHV